MPPMRMKTKGVPSKPKDVRATLKRLLSYMKPYKARLILVCICIVLSAVTNSVAALFMKNLIDGYIVPMLSQNVPDFAPLLRMLFSRIASIDPMIMPAIPNTNST